MSFSSMLKHTCNIHKVKRDDVLPGYGLPVSSDYYFSHTPDYSNVVCYVEEMNSVANQPILSGGAYVVKSKYKLYFPLDTDIDFDDVIIWEGLNLRLELPKNIRNHHLEVIGNRDDRVVYE